MILDTRAPRRLLLTAVVVLAGCAAGPDYMPHEIETGVGWALADSIDTTLEPGTLGRWWARFQDPTLSRLVETALRQNLDVREAAERVAEARARRDQAAGGRWPAISATGRATERRQSENGPIPVASIPGLDRDQTIFDVGFDASWELDVFGKTSRTVESAEALVAGAVQQRRAAELTIAAEVTRTYLALGATQRRLAAIDSLLADTRRTADLVGLRVAHGEAPRVDLSRAEIDIRSREGERARLAAQLDALAVALSTLTGTLPETELRLAGEERPPLVLAALPVGQRAEILGRRPDVLAAERRLAAATADVGVASADLYPRLTIGAHAGFEALDAADLFEEPSQTLSVTPMISWRLFEGGRVRAEIRAAEARTRIAALAWERAVLGALSDAEQALRRYRGSLEAIDAERAAVAAATRVRDAERARHESGESSLLALLDAERRLDEAEAALAAFEVDASGDLVALIKALGGGWQDGG